MATNGWCDCGLQLYTSEAAKPRRNAEAFDAPPNVVYLSRAAPTAGGTETLGGSHKFHFVELAANPQGDRS